MKRNRSKLVQHAQFTEFEAESGQEHTYEIDPASLSSEDRDRLEQLIAQSTILDYETQHRGPAHGEHEISITVEDNHGEHEVITCDVQMSAEHVELAEFLKEKGAAKHGGGNSYENSPGN